MRSRQLRELVGAIVEDLPAAVVLEAVLTGSVSRGVADELSDIEMLLVVEEAPTLDECLLLAAGAGLRNLGTWGPQGGPVQRVSGVRDDVPVELMWWSRAYADRQVERCLRGAAMATAEALAHGVALRTTGLLAGWQAQLQRYPAELVAQTAEQAALPWGGFAAAGVLTLVRPGERLALMEWVLDGAQRVLDITYALNRTWRPSSKRLTARLDTLNVKPDRLAERLEEALTALDQVHALLVITELELEAVHLAPSGPNVDRARSWLAAAAEHLRRVR